MGARASLHFQFCGFPLESVGHESAARRFVTVAVTTLLFGGLVVAQQQDFSKAQIKVSKVAGNVYMLQGGGGNIGASVGDDGIVIVDDQYAPPAERIQAALKGITDKPVRFIITRTIIPTTRAGMSTARSRRRLLCRTTCANGWRAGACTATAGKFKWN